MFLQSKWGGRTFPFCFLFKKKNLKHPALTLSPILEASARLLWFRGVSFHLSGQSIRWLRNKKGPWSHLVGHIPCCGLLSTVAVNTLVLMLMMSGSTNLEDAGLAMIWESSEKSLSDCPLFIIRFLRNYFQVDLGRLLLPIWLVQSSVEQEIPNCGRPSVSRSSG